MLWSFCNTHCAAFVILAEKSSFGLQTAMLLRHWLQCSLSGLLCRCLPQLVQHVWHIPAYVDTKKCLCFLAHTAVGIVLSGDVFTVYRELMPQSELANLFALQLHAACLHESIAVVICRPDLHSATMRRQQVPHSHILMASALNSIPSTAS